MTTPTPTTTPPATAFAASSGGWVSRLRNGELRAWLAGCGFVADVGGRVHRHPTGARVVFGNGDPAAPVDLTVHAYGGAWRARLTRVPFPVLAAAVDRKDWV